MFAIFAPDWPVRLATQPRGKTASWMAKATSFRYTHVAIVVSLTFLRSCLRHALPAAAAGDTVMVLIVDCYISCYLLGTSGMEAGVSHECDRHQLTERTLGIW